MSQIMALLNHAPEIQQRILAGDTSIPERRLRAALRTANWEEQRAALKHEPSKLAFAAAATHASSS